MGTILSKYAQLTIQIPLIAQMTDNLQPQLVAICCDYVGGECPCEQEDCNTIFSKHFPYMGKHWDKNKSMQPMEIMEICPRCGSGVCGECFDYSTNECADCNYYICH